MMSDSGSAKTATAQSQGSPSHLLIVLMGSIGDVARGLTLIPRIKRNWPTTRISWIVEPKSEGLVRLAAGVDRVVVFPRGGGLRALYGFFRELRSEPYDVALDLQRHAKSGLVTKLSRCPRRIGFSRQNAKEGNWLLSTERVPAFDEESLNKGEVYHQFLDLLGAARSGRDFALELDTLAHDGSARLPVELPPHYVVCVMGSSWESKNWLPSGYVVLGKKIISQFRESLVLVGDSSQRESAQQVARALAPQEGSSREGSVHDGPVEDHRTPHTENRVIDLVGRTSIGQLAHILASARLVIGPDSGPGHIAAGLGVPVVSLFGPTSPARTAPLEVARGSAPGGSVTVLQSAVGCAPCYQRVCPGLNRVCMRLISPDAVLGAASGYLQDSA